MTTNGRPYTDPLVNRQDCSGGMTTAGAGTGTYCRNVDYQARNLMGFGGVVVTAGTAAGAVIHAMIGTATVASCTLGTAVALSTGFLTVASASRAVAALTQVATKIIGDDTLVCVPVYEFQVDKAAVFSD